MTAFTAMTAALTQERRADRFPKAGDVYGRLTILGPYELNAYSQRVYACRCSCAADVKVRFTLLRTGVTSSCGCYRRDHARQMQPLAAAARRR